MIKKDNSRRLFEEGSKYIPGGVNSPVRAFKSVGGDPLFIRKAKGAYLYDEDGNQFVDLINSWGPMILGHANPEVQSAVSEALPASLSFGAPARKEVEMAELICAMVPSVEMVRMVNSGTEATMSAIRLARGYTGRDKIIKFIGCYHGHGDSFLIAAGSGAATMGIPNSPGVTENTALDTLVAPYNDLEAVHALAQQNSGDIAAIIVEPVAGNMGCVLPGKGFLEGLRDLCDEEGIVLIFDEVMTGFRLAPGGAQQILNVMPDLTTLGKIIGGGLPVGAYGGKKEIMNRVAPAGPVYQAGTLSGNPVAMAAGYATLIYLREHPEVYTKIEEATKAICKGFQKNLSEVGKEYQINQVGSMMSLFFTEDPVYDFSTAAKSDTVLFGHYFNAMLEQGIYNAPSQFESLFISTAIEGEIVDKIVQANRTALHTILSA
jgi:glutamate-1-semialdehyde 2,1-aminomutase